MRIVFCCMQFAPDHTGLAAFTTGVAEHLADAGHEVEVIAAMPHYPQWQFPPEYGRKLHVRERRGNVSLHRWRVPIPKRRSALGRVVYNSSIAAFALATIPILRRPDVIIAVSPPIQLALATGVAAKVLRASHITYVQDLPVDLALSVGMLKPGRLVALARALERWGYRFSEKVVSISPGFDAPLRASGVSDRQLVLIPNWGDETSASPEQTATWRARLGAGPDEFLAVYAGNMGEKQDLETPVRAITSADMSGVRLALVGDGAARPLLEAQVAAAQSEAVQMLPLQPREAVAGILSAADVLLLTQRADVLDSVAPSKLLSYMAAGRPVVAAVHADSETARLVRSTGCGIVCKPEDTGEFSAAVQRLRSDPAAAKEMGRLGREAAHADFSAAGVLRRWERVVDECAAGLWSTRAIPVALRCRPVGARSACPGRRTRAAG